MHCFYFVSERRFYAHKLNRGEIKSAALKREVEGGSTFTLTSDLSCIASVYLICEHKFYAITGTLRETGNPP